MLMIVGLVALMPMSLRLVRWGRRRQLPRSWMVWLPLAAPAIWLAGVAISELSTRDQFREIEALPEAERAQALAKGIAGALQLTLGAGIFALAVLAACFVFFTLRPRATEKVDPGPGAS